MVSDKSLADFISSSTNAAYWQVGGRYFFNKHECLQFATTIKNYNITFHYHDELRKSLDWTREPSISLKDLYKERARQIREEYDYVILKFSGGSDSRNILYTFLDNDIRLDEIMTSHQQKACELLKPNFKRSHTGPEHLIFEYELAAKPVLDEVSKTHPHIRIQLIDSINTAIEFTDKSRLKDFALGGIAVNVEFANRHVTSEITRTRGKRACVIYGADKPRILFNKAKRKAAFYFNDFSMVHTNNTIFQFDNSTDECFYYTNQLPVLHQKQCFVIKNALVKLLEQNEMAYDLLVFEKWNGGDWDVIKVHHPFIKSILYDNFDPNVWQARKLTSQFYLESGSWFFDKSFVSDRTKDFYDAQIREYVQGIDPTLVEYKNGKPRNFKNFFTNPVLF